MRRLGSDAVICRCPYSGPWAKMRAYIDCLRQDAAFHAFVFAYAVVGLVFGIAAGVPHKFVPLSYVDVLAGEFPAVPALVLVGAGVWSLGSATPLLTFRGTLGKMLGPRAVAGLLLFASLCVFVGVFSSIKTMLPDVVPFFADQYLADLDRLIHGQAPWKYVVAVLPAQATPLIEVLYFMVWGTLLPGSMLAVLLVPRLGGVRRQYVWTFLIAWPLLGNVVAAAMMSAGPVYYEFVTGDARFSGLIANLSAHSLVQLQGQRFLWNAYTSGAAGVASGISAFPSLHLANATLFALLARRCHPWVTWVGGAFCFIILVGSVYLGWHYAVDGYFAIATTLLIWKAVGLALGVGPAGRGEVPLCDASTRPGRLRLDGLGFVAVRGLDGVHEDPRERKRGVGHDHKAGSDHLRKD